MKNLLWIMALALLVGCAKDEGEGGNSSIYGNVNLLMYNETFTLELYEIEAADYDVFIVYGDEIGYSDKTETDYKGNYRFPYLREGDYTIYVYSKIKPEGAVFTDVPDQEALIKTVNLDKKEDLEMEDFTVLDS